MRSICQAGLRCRVDLWYTGPGEGRMARITLDGWPFDAVDGDGGCIDAATTLQMIACGPVPPPFRLAHGITDGLVLAFHLAPHLDAATSQPPGSSLAAWCLAYRHDPAALAALRASCVQPHLLTPSELVENL